MENDRSCELLYRKYLGILKIWNIKMNWTKKSRFHFFILARFLKANSHKICPNHVFFLKVIEHA